MVEVYVDVDEEQIHQSCEECVGEGDLLSSQVGSILVQVLIYGGAGWGICES